MTKRIEKMNIELAGNYADELKTLVSSLCEDIKDSESVTDAWNKIDRFTKMQSLCETNKNVLAASLLVFLQMM